VRNFDFDLGSSGRQGKVTIRRPRGAEAGAEFDQWLLDHGIQLWDIDQGTDILVDYDLNELEYESTGGHLHGATLVWKDGRGVPKDEWVVSD